MTIRQDNSRKSVQYRLNESPEEILEQLFDEYIRDGTVVRRSLRLWGTPPFMKRRRENEVDLKMKVTNLELETHQTDDYDHFIRFINLDVLENVRVIAEDNSVALLDKPQVSEYS